jgi:protein TonB
MPSSGQDRQPGFAALPLHISLVLSLVLHLVAYTVGDWLGLRAAPVPPPRRIIDAMLILPEIKVPVQESPPAQPLVPEPAAPQQSPDPAVMPAQAPPAPPATGTAAAPPQRHPAARPTVPDPLAFYPPEAVLRGIEGDVDVSIRLDAAGNVVAARVGRGSGHAILDEAAVRAALTLKGLPGGRGETVLPVRFRLR